jgi:hypothetical protein
VKPNKQLICHLLLAILCASMTGCGSVSSYEPLGNGYISVAHTEHSMSEEDASQFDLQYSPGKGKWWIKVWPDMGMGIVVTNGVAVFGGERAFEKPEHFWEHCPTESRVFAVKSPDMPMDITDEILWKWSKQSNGNFAKIQKTASFVYVKETNNIVGFYFANRVSDLNIYLDWNQITDIMREVKEKGVVRKDLQWGTKYLEKEFKPEVQK